MKNLLKIFCIIANFFALIKGSHFRGGWITFTPISSTATDVTMEFSAFWSWNRGTYYCDQNTIASKTLIGPTDGITCKTGCRVTGESIGNVQFFCTSFSASESWSYGERKFIYTIPKVSLYKASFTGCCWISLYNGMAPAWEIPVSINSLVRTDTGKINSSPITKMFPVIRIRSGLQQKITIPISDKDNDIIKCRWSSLSNGECGGVCSYPAVASLNSEKCELSFDATKATVGWYALSISIEDFAKKSDTIPLSTVVVQFMVYVVNVASNCKTP